MCYHMSSKDGQPASASAFKAAPAVVPITDVPPGARVRHFDELSDRTQQALTTALPSGHLDIDPESTNLSRGDVVVFTEYVRIH
ncbi:hypothetical protein SAMN04488691_105239 [Haloferax larsenii]|uniref:DUF7979 domain-containing protein n=2 Tax=Haloferax larsenii TaxID=302484 RepID=A0A1H7R257_HALLR|nr:hypothetical protein SAMN04488691_105239 [Haloferax larsenii]